MIATVPTKLRTARKVRTDADKYREEREAVRAILHPSPVRLHHVPGWLRLRMLGVFGCGGGSTSGWAVLHHAAGSWPSWLDHFGSTVLPNGKRAFVSEPYGFTPEMAEELKAFCSPMGLSWHVDPNAEWYPGRTVRIVIQEPAE